MAELTGTNLPTTAKRSEAASNIAINPLGTPCLMDRHFLLRSRRKAAVIDPQGELERRRVFMPGANGDLDRFKRIHPIAFFTRPSAASRATAFCRQGARRDGQYHEQ